MAAAQVFKENGYDKAPMRTIADKVGIKEPSLYHHIKSKDQMLYEIVKGTTQAGISRVSNIRAMRVPPDEKISLCFRSHFDSLLKSYPEVSVLIHEKISLLPSHQAKEIRKLYRKYVHIISDIIAKGIQGKVFKKEIDVKLSTWALLGMVNWSYKWCKIDGRVPFDQVADLFAKIFLTGITRQKSQRRMQSFRGYERQS